jgi:hypothetical protein
MSVPDSVRDEIKETLEKRADEIGWMRLPAPRKSLLYEQWTRDAAIGGVLANYLDARRVRVYIKDTLLKDYVPNTLADAALPLRALAIPSDAPIVEVLIKPHGRRLRDGRVISWGRADDWKTVLMATYERAYAGSGRRPFGAVLLQAVGRYGQDDARGMVENAAKLLGVERVAWLAP